METSELQMIVKGQGRCFLVPVAGAVHPVHGFQGSPESVHREIKSKADAHEQDPGSEVKPAPEPDRAQCAHGKGDRGGYAQLGQPDKHIEFFHLRPIPPHNNFLYYNHKPVKIQ